MGLSVELYRPHKKQLEIHEAIDKDGKYYFVTIGRQFGKTILAENQVIKWALENAGWRIAWVSPTYKQCKKVFKDIRRALDESNIYAKKPNESDLVIYLINGSEILFYSAEAYDSIRGETFDAGVGDEMAFWKREAWTEVLKATLLVKGKKFLGLSTPKGKNLFYELCLQSQVDDSYKTFKGTSYDNPFIDIKEIEDAKRTLPEHIFKQEYLAEFIDDGGSVFVNIKNCIKKGIENNNYYFGLDLGKTNDYTVLTIVNSNNEEVFCERWRQMEWSMIINNVVSKLNQYKPKGYVECNGAQDSIYEQIKSKVKYNKNSIQPFTTTSKTKPIIIENLIMSFQDESIGIIGHEFQIDELEQFTYEYNHRTRTIKYEAPAGLHDDYVMSRAISNYAIKNLKSFGKYSVI
jgi:phage terminase large subunit-like protein